MNLLQLSVKLVSYWREIISEKESLHVCQTEVTCILVRSLLVNSELHVLHGFSALTMRVLIVTI